MKGPLLNSIPPKVFNSVEDAEKAANELRTGDPEWNYIVVPDTKTNKALIALYDEDNSFISYW